MNYELFDKNVDYHVNHFKRGYFKLNDANYESKDFRFFIILKHYGSLTRLNSKSQYNMADPTCLLESSYDTLNPFIKLNSVLLVVNAIM